MRGIAKAFGAFAAALALVVLALPARAAGPQLTATRAYCIMDAASGLVLAQQNMDEELHPASITKVMTLGLACEKAQGDWSGSYPVTHEDVYSLAGTDSSHIALLEGEQVPLEDLLYATMMASANDAANVLAEYIGEGTIQDGVDAMNAKAVQLGLQHTHFSNPHGISDEEHYTSCYDMAQILRWALDQPGFEQLFTNNEMYIMQPTNHQPVTRYFSQQDSMRVGSSMFYEPTILGSKIGYTDIARQTYICLAEKDGLRLICVVMRSDSRADRYADVRTLLEYAFSTWTGYTAIDPAQNAAQISVRGGGGPLGQLTLNAPGIRLPLAAGLDAGNVTLSVDLPEEYILGEELEAWAVYTVQGNAYQETASVRVPLQPEGLDALLAGSRGAAHPAAEDVAPAGHLALVLGTAAAGMLAMGAAVFLWGRRSIRTDRAKPVE